MTKALRAMALWPMAVAVPLAFSGCDQTGGGAPQAGGPPPGGPGYSLPPGGGPDVAGSSEIRTIMGKLTKGPNSLQQVLGRELKEASPPWDTIQTQTKEYASLAEALGKNDPPRGSKESWTKQTAAYTELAAALDKAAQEKNKDDAVAAHGQLANSCMACHREHRRMGPGMMGGPPPGGFRGGPPGGFGGPGGPPGAPPPGGGPGGPPGAPPPPGGPPPDGPPPGGGPPQ